MIRQCLAALAAVSFALLAPPARANPTHGAAYGPGSYEIADSNPNGGNYFMITGFSDDNNFGSFNTVWSVNNDGSIWWTIEVTGDSETEVDYVYGPWTDILPPGWAPIQSVMYGFGPWTGTHYFNASGKANSFCWLSGMSTPGALQAGGIDVYYQFGSVSDTDWLVAIQANAGIPVQGSVICMTWPFSGIQFGGLDTVVTSLSALCNPGQPYHCINLPDPNTYNCALEGFDNFGNASVSAFGSAEEHGSQLVEHGGQGTNGRSSCLKY